MRPALVCDPHAAFDDLCNQMAARDPSHLAGPVVEHLLGPALVLVALLLMGRSLRRIISRAILRAGGDVQARALVENVITAVSISFAILAALVAGGLDIKVLLTFGGLASLAVGLAFQDVLRNLLAGIFLLIEKPFRIGDVVTVDPHTGVVEAIELRTTTLRTADGRLAILPNLSAFNNTVVNQSAYDRRQYTVSIRVEEASDLSSTMASARAALGEVREIADQPPPSIVPHIDVDGAVVLDCRYWLDYREFSPDAVTAAVAQRLWEAVRRPPGMRAAAGAARVPGR